MKSGRLKQREVQAVSRALADQRRFAILKVIASSQIAACSDLRNAFPITAATLSHHLKELESAGLIDTARVGKFVHATFRRDRWEAYLSELNSI